MTSAHARPDSQLLGTGLDFSLADPARELLVFIF